MLNHQLIFVLSVLLVGACGQDTAEKTHSQSQVSGIFDGWKNNQDNGKNKDKGKGKDKDSKFEWDKKKKKQVLSCRIVVVNKVGDYGLEDYVRFTLYGKKRYKDYDHFKKDQSELSVLIEKSMQKCKSDGIGKIDSRVCNSINTANFRGISSFHYFNYPGFETYGGNWVCSLSETKPQ